MAPSTRASRSAVFIQDHFHRTGPQRHHHEIQHLDPPRTEAQEHYYRAAHTKLIDLGLDPWLLDDDIIRGMADLVSASREGKIHSYPDLIARSLNPAY